MPTLDSAKLIFTAHNLRHMGRYVAYTGLSRHAVPLGGRCLVIGETVGALRAQRDATPRAGAACKGSKT